MTTAEMLCAAKRAAAGLALLEEAEKNRALLAMAAALRQNAPDILCANALDVEEHGPRLGEVMTDRLRLTPERIEGMAAGMEAVAALPDPVGRTLEEFQNKAGLTVRKVSVPMGVVAIIYESRPNVTSDAAALCFKSGNVCILRGGKEAYRTTAVIIGVLRGALTAMGLDADCIHMPEDTTRASAKALMEAVGYVDVLIPRGGAGLIRACVEGAKVPCIQTGTGVCHIYVDRAADLAMALDILENAKTSRPSVCNAAEVCLVHRAIAPVFLPMLYRRLVTDRADAGHRPVELRTDGAAAAFIPGTPAVEGDFDREFLDYALAVGVVEDVGEAVSHIGRHSTKHSDCIVSADPAATAYFTAAVDSAAVYVNASTRFTDGGEFGLGCEIGISTQKLHARGPMGLSELTSYKYVILGNGQVR